MAWLDVPDDTATPELERLTEPWRRRGEQVPPVIAVLKANPSAFSAVLSLNYAVTFGASRLGRVREELIAVWVSALNRCFFCLATHARYLEQVWPRAAGELVPLLRALASGGYRACGAPNALETALSELGAAPSLPAGDRALLAFVAELSLAPAKTAEPGFRRLREAGFSEAEILDAVLVAGCFALMNRLANGTGVELDPSKEESVTRLLGREALDEHRTTRGARP